MKFIFGTFLGIVLMTGSCAANATDSTITHVLVEEHSLEKDPGEVLIDQNQINQKKSFFLKDSLRDVSGINMLQSGPPGQNLFLSIRGARNEDTLVLIDGMEANDILTPGRIFDFAQLSTVDIDHIEIRKGSQGVLFGPGATGGVINIVTKNGHGDPGKEYLLSAGSYGTTWASGHIRGTTESTDYSATAEVIQTQGFSSAAARYGNSEPDGFSSDRLAIKLNQDVDFANLEENFRYSTNHEDLDRFGGPGGDDPNDTADSSQIQTGIKASKKFNDSIRSTLLATYLESNRSTRNNPDRTDASFSTNDYLSEGLKVDSNNRYDFSATENLSVIFQYKSESGYSAGNSGAIKSDTLRQTESTIGAGALFKSNNSLFYELGARSDHNSVFGDTPNYKAMVGTYFGVLKTFATFSTSVKSPSIYQLYSDFGTSTLEPEKSKNYEISFEVPDLNLTLFNDDYQNLIDFNTSTNRYQNIARAKARGAELSLDHKFPSNIDTHLTYTYTEAKDDTTGLNQLRRPRDLFRADVVKSFPTSEVTLEYDHLGQREDLDPATFARTNLGSNDIFNLITNWHVTQSTDAFLRLENIFDRDYEEIAGYGTARFSGYVGVQGRY